MGLLPIASSVVAVQASGSRLGIIQSDGKLFYKEGIPDGTFVEQYQPAKAFCVQHNYLGMIASDGHVYTKSDVSDHFIRHTGAGSGQAVSCKIAVGGNRIYWLSSTNHLDGALATHINTSTHQHDYIVDYQASSNLLAVISTNANCYLKGGAMDAEFADMAPNVASCSVAGGYPNGRIVVVQTDGSVISKNGKYNWFDDPWLPVQIPPVVLSKAKSVSCQGLDRIVLLTESHELILGRLEKDPTHEILHLKEFAKIDNVRSMKVGDGLVQFLTTAGKCYLQSSPGGFFTELADHVSDHSNRFVLIGNGLFYSEP